MEDQERHPAKTLDDIRAGGAKLLLMCQTKYKELGEAMERGLFMDAANRASELHSDISRLAQAESSLASLTRSSVVRAADIEEGMHVGPGKVTSVEIDSHKCLGHQGDHVVVTLKWGDELIHTYDGDDQMVVHNVD